MDMNWKQMWTALGVVFAIVAATVSITLTITLTVIDRQISGLERLQSQQAESTLAIISGLERSQSQQAESILAITGSQISALERSQAQQTESILIQLRLLNDKMSNIESEHTELRSLYEKVGVLQTEVAYIRRDLDTVRDNQEAMRADLDTILEMLGTSDGSQ